MKIVVRVLILTLAISANCAFAESFPSSDKDLESNINTTTNDDLVVEQHETPSSLPSEAYNATSVSEIKPEIVQKKQREFENNRFTQALNEFALTALSFVGTKYKWGGVDPNTGFDCSGLIKYLFSENLEKDVPRSTSLLKGAGVFINRNELRIGDLVFFNTLRRPFSHVGIYLGDDKFIHSPRSGKTIIVEDMSKNYWQQRFNGARRILSKIDFLAQNKD